MQARGTKRSAPESSSVAAGYDSYVRGGAATQCADRLVNLLLGKDEFLVRELAQSQTFVICDMRIVDHPITFVSDGFCEMTGYSREHIVGHNCRFLQGPDTDVAVVRRMGKMLRAGEIVVEKLVNYKRDGRRFVNMLQMIPLMDSEGNLTHYLGLQQELPEFTKFEHCPDRAPGQDYTGRARRGPDDAAAGDSVDDVLASLGVDAFERDFAALCVPDVDDGFMNDTMSSLGGMLKINEHAMSQMDSLPSGCEGTGGTSFTVANMMLPGFPLTFVSEGFLKLTGYSREEVIGQRITFLHGENTEKEASDRLMHALTSRTSSLHTITSYKKNGTAFQNQQHISFLSDPLGETWAVGMQFESAESKSETDALFLELRRGLGDSQAHQAHQAHA